MKSLLTWTLAVCAVMTQMGCARQPKVVPLPFSVEAVQKVVAFEGGDTIAVLEESEEIRALFRDLALRPREKCMHLYDCVLEVAMEDSVIIVFVEEDHMVASGVAYWCSPDLHRRVLALSNGKR